LIFSWGIKPRAGSISSALDITVTQIIYFISIVCFDEPSSSCATTKGVAKKDGK
jgi:hypothetical protein